MNIKKGLTLAITLVFLLLPCAAHAVVTGKLDNGLSYALDSNEKGSESLSLRLVVRSGSALETEEQQGLAHFVEHMLFKGSDSFPKMTALKSLEEYGAFFGKHINAATSYDSTSFYVNLPTTDKKALDIAIKILGDMAFHASFDPQALELERGVILDEYRRTISSSSYMSRKTRWDSLMEGSSYASRQPIGIPAIIEKTSAENLKAFYSQWYTPERMTVVVTGNFDTKKAQKHIQEYFSHAPKNMPAEKDYHKPPFAKTPRASIHKDGNATHSTVHLLFPTRASHLSSQDEYLKETVYSVLLHSLLNIRLAEAQEDENTTLIAGSSFFSQPITGVIIHKIFARSFLGDTTSAVKELGSLVKAIRTSGFTANELLYAKKALMVTPKSSSQQILTEYALKKTPFASDKLFYSKALPFLKEASLKDFNSWAMAFFTTTPPFLGLSTHESLGLTPQKVITEYSKAQPKPYLSKEAHATTLTKKLPFPGAISSREVVSKKLSVIHYTLENGMNVIIKPTKTYNDAVIIKGIAAGPAKKYDVAYKIANQMGKSGGCGAYSNAELMKILAGKSVTFNTSIVKKQRAFTSYVTPDDIETSFQLIHHLFTTSTSSNATYKQALKEKLLYAPSLFKKYATTNSLKKVAYKAAQRYLTSFEKPSDFTIYIVGAFDSKKMQTLIQHYLASIPSTSKKQLLITNTSLGNISLDQCIQQNNTKDTPHDKGIKTSISIPLAKEHNDLVLNMAIPLLQQRLTTALRFKLGETYHVTVKKASSGKELSVSFYSKSTETAKRLSYEALTTLYEASNSINAKEVEAVKRYKVASLQQNLNDNEYWANSIIYCFKQDIPIKRITQTVDSMDNVTAEDIHKELKSSLLLSKASVKNK
jgi:zinc protease